MKRKKKNKYDNLIEELIREFGKIQNLNLTYENEIGRKIFSFSTKRIAELSSYRTLFLNYYLKAASKAIVDNLKEIENSKYKKYLNITKEDLKENFYETIRLGYIGLFHKYENYIVELIEMAGLISEDCGIKNQISLVQYSKKEFNFEIKDWKVSKFIEYINWVAICNKHYDGYPRKSQPKTFLISLAEDEKMRFSKSDFERDTKIMISWYSQIMELVFLIVQHKIVFEYLDYEEAKSNSKELEIKRKATLTITQLIDLYKC